MKNVVAGMIMVALIVLGFYYVADAATPKEAQELLERASSYLNVNGHEKEKALAEISNPTGQFVNGDLYVFVLNFNGVNLADGGNPGFVGANHSGLKDTNGKYFIKEMIETAKNKGSGWVDYTWLNPDTKKIQPKITYVKRIKGMDALIGCGVLK